MFKKQNLIWDGMYLTYNLTGNLGDLTDRRFVARFKYKGVVSKAQFVKQLVTNHTPEEYFAKLHAGMAPLDILRQADPSWYEKLVAIWKIKNGVAV